MRIIVLTDGRPEQCFVINAIHHRFPVSAVFQRRLAHASPMGTPLRRAYWQLYHGLASRGQPGRRTLGDRWRQHRVTTLYQQRYHRAIAAELGIDLDYGLHPTIALTQVQTYDEEDVIHRIRDAQPDLVLSIGCPLLREPLLSLPRIGLLNCHTALLPDFRGTHVEHWILLTGRHDRAGVTVHWINEGLDTGDIAAQRAIPIRRGDDPSRIRMRSMRQAGDAFAEVLDAVGAGKRLATRQPPNGHVYRARDLSLDMRWRCLTGRNLPEPVQSFTVRN